LAKKSLPSGFFGKWTTILIVTIFSPLFSYTLSQWLNRDRAEKIIDAHPRLLQQALTNVLDNAVKFSPKGKEICLRLYNNGAEVVLEVSDKGIGIAAEEQSRISEKFHRCENLLVQTTRGTGLGLPLVKHIMEIHHGCIQVFSKPGQGTTL